MSVFAVCDIHCVLLTFVSFVKSLCLFELCLNWQVVIINYVVDLCLYWQYASFTVSFRPMSILAVCAFYCVF